jgi:hypothetical protein
MRVIVNSTYKNLTVKSMMFPHHKFTWMSPDGKTHNHIDHILIDRQHHSSVLMSDHSHISYGEIQFQKINEVV